jgi:hypothetical protein
VGRYSPDAESTVYFCALEALQNVAKHARASRVTVRLAAAEDGLEFSVTDDGAGFPAAAQRPGSGLQGMADRLAAHGGTLDIRSEPGHGTTVTGRLPAPPVGHDPGGNGVRPPGPAESGERQGGVHRAVIRGRDLARGPDGVDLTHRATDVLDG